MARKSDEVSGQPMRMSGRELLDHLGKQRSRSLPPHEHSFVRSPGEALDRAKSGELGLWSGMYQPGPEAYTLSMVVNLDRKIDDVVEMLKFIITRLDE